MIPLLPVDRQAHNLRGLATLRQGKITCHCNIRRLSALLTAGNALCTE